MTWITAMTSSELPYAACVSDIQITFRKGENKITHNGLRKVYRINYSLAVGFSGSVSMGFKLLEDIRQQKAHWYDNPQLLMSSWPKRAARIFQSVKGRASASGSLLIFGLDKRNPQKIIPFVYKLRSPDFIPYKAKGPELLSIGSGSQQYATAIQETCNQPNSFTAYERGEFRGRGIGIGLIGMMALEWRHRPADGISEELLCTIVSPYDSVDFPYRATIGMLIPKKFGM